MLSWLNGYRETIGTIPFAGIMPFLTKHRSIKHLNIIFTQITKAR